MFNFKSLTSLVIGSLLTISSVAMADETGTVDLSGEVTSTLNLTVATAGTGMALDLTPATNRIALVGTITTSTNNESGLTIQTSDGNLTGTGASIAYQSAAAASLPTAPADFALPNMASTGGGSFDQSLYIMYSPAAYQNAGEYTGQITVIVSDN